MTAHLHRDPSVTTYRPVSEYVSNEVLASRESILAEEKAAAEAVAEQWPASMSVA